MPDELEISQEQADLLEASVEVCLNSLLETGELVPSLYVADENEVACYQLEVESLEELRTHARAAIESAEEDLLAYALLYASTIKVEDEHADVLVIETGDVDDEEAVELATSYNRGTKQVAPAPFLLGKKNNLLASPQFTDSQDSEEE